MSPDGIKKIRGQLAHLDIRDQLAALEMARRDALYGDPPDVAVAVTATEAKIELMREHGLFEPPPVLTPQQEAQLREQLDIEIAETEAADRRFHGRRES
jgi:hypothetical protein